MGKRYKVTYDDGTTEILDHNPLAPPARPAGAPGKPDASGVTVPGPGGMPVYPGWGQPTKPGLSNLWGLLPEGTQVNPALTTSGAGVTVGDVARYGPAMATGNPLLAAGLSGAGEAAAQGLEGRPLDPGAMGWSAMFGGLGALAGQVLPRLGRLRVSGTGQGKDAAMVAGALERVDPLLKPPAPTVEGLQRHMVGGGAQAGASAARDRGIAAIEAELRRRGTAAYQALPAGERNVATVDLPERAATRFKELRDELADVGRAAFNPTSGDVRPGAGTLQKLRTREEILQEMEATLPADLFTRWRGLQGEYSKVAEMQRLFEPTARVGNPIGGPGADATAGVLEGSGLNMRELQRRAAENEAPIRSHLGPQAEGLLRTIYRGGQPPVGDRRMQYAFSRHGGMAVPLGLTYKAGPPVEAAPTLGQLLRALVEQSYRPRKDRR